MAVVVGLIQKKFNDQLKETPTRHFPRSGRALPGLRQTKARSFALEAYLSVQDFSDSIYNLVK